MGGSAWPSRSEASPAGSWPCAKVKGVIDFNQIAALQAGANRSPLAGPRVAPNRSRRCTGQRPGTQWPAGTEAEGWAREQAFDGPSICGWPCHLGGAGGRPGSEAFLRRLTPAHRRGA